jgi:hypothetical protein
MVNFLSIGVGLSPHGKMQLERQLVASIAYVGVLAGKAYLQI